MHSILLADDHALLRQGLSQIINNHPGYQVVAESDNGASAAEAILSHKPDLAIIDQSMPQMPGIDVIKHCLARNSECVFILLTMHEEPLVAIEALQAGASGFVLKGNDSSVLLEAMESVLKHEIYVSPSFQYKIDQCQVEQLLSAREKDVLSAIARGFTAKETARLFKISTTTVGSYRSRIGQKTNMHSIAELTRLAINLGLL